MEWTGKKGALRVSQRPLPLKAADATSIEAAVLLPFFGVLLGLFLHGESPSAVVLEGAGVAASNPLRFVYE